MHNVISAEKQSRQPKIDPDALSGILLLSATVIALICSNTSMEGLYQQWLHIKMTISIGPHALSKPMLLWVNDGLMSIFFLLVGMEIKKELLEGSLSKASALVLPGLAALGGMTVPALIYYLLNRAHPDAMTGWAIPAATDIAFALGVLALLGPRVPRGLKIFLMTLSILDDLGAIILIALFYSHDLSIQSLLAGLAAILLLILLNWSGITRAGLYLLLGLILWLCVLKSGVHATLSGVVLAFTIPMRDKNGQPGPLFKIEHCLKPWVNFLILPLFAFVNAGISFKGLTFADIISPVPLGIMLGLFLGKQLGVFTSSFIAIKTKIAKLPAGVTWRQLYGVSVLCGIGFTMSLFIGTLAFEHGVQHYLISNRLGILIGSLFSGILGFAILKNALNRPKE